LAKHLSVLKRARQNEKRRKRNASIETRLKTLKKGVLTAVEAEDSAKAGEALAKAIPHLAKAASKGVIRKKSASRYISRLTKKVNALATKPAPAQGNP